MQEPSASRTALLAKFSDAISSKPYVCLCFSFLMMLKTWRKKRERSLTSSHHNQKKNQVSWAKAAHFDSCIYLFFYTVRSLVFYSVMRLMQTSESLLARGSSIILLWDCHVSWLTMCPFVRDMMAVQSRKLENLQGEEGEQEEEEETVHYSLGDITYNICTYCTVYTSTFFSFSSHHKITCIEDAGTDSTEQPHDPHIQKLWLKSVFCQFHCGCLMKHCCTKSSRSNPITTENSRQDTILSMTGGHIGGQLRQFQAVMQLCNHAIRSHQLNFKPSQPVR